MINDLLVNFKKAHEDFGDKMVLDYYTPKTGLYIRINKDGTRDYLVIEKDSYKDDLYNWFKDRDYYSTLIEMNKPIDNKKIHSNNIYTVFMKKDNFPEMTAKSISKSEYKGLIFRYYDALKNYDKKSDKYTKDLFEEIKQKTDENVVRKNIDYLITNLDEMIMEIKTQEFDNYISIYFDAAIEDYRRESERYLIPKIYNKNDYNVNYAGKVYGLSNSNMGMNSKKPFLESKTKKATVPYRVTIEDAILIKKLFDWLVYKKDRDFSIVYDYDFAGGETELIKIKKGTAIHTLRVENEGTKQSITDYEYLPHFTKTIDFLLENTLDITKKENGIEYTIGEYHIDNIFELEKIADEYFFNNKLTNNYYGKIGSGISNNLKNLIYISRKSFFNFFRRGNIEGLKNQIDYIGREIIKENIRSVKGTFFYKAAYAYNLRISFMKYLNKGGDDMADKIKSLMGLLKEKGKVDIIATCDSDEEFYFAAGQLAYYLLSLSETSQKTHGLAEPFLRANTAEELKRQLRNIYDKYNHAINFNNIRFNQIFSAVMGYVTKERMKSQEDMFLAGLTAKNLFYISTKKESKENKTGEEKENE